MQQARDISFKRIMRVYVERPISYVLEASMNSCNLALNDCYTYCNSSAVTVIHGKRCKNDQILPPD